MTSANGDSIGPLRAALDAAVERAVPLVENASDPEEVRRILGVELRRALEEGGFPGDGD